MQNIQSDRAFVVCFIFHICIVNGACCGCCWKKIPFLLLLLFFRYDIVKNVVLRDVKIRIPFWKIIYKLQHKSFKGNSFRSYPNTIHYLYIYNKYRYYRIGELRMTLFKRIYVIDYTSLCISSLSFVD